VVRSLPVAVAETKEASTERPVEFAVPVLSGVAALGLLATLAVLPYSTSWISRVSVSEAEAAPGTRAEVGSLTWNIEEYQKAPALEPFRVAFQAKCGNTRGVAAARCVSDHLSAHSPRGVPTGEFVDQDYDPAAALKGHLEGGPGHCTARASMTATALLALGIPARVVQILPPNKRGHNLLEVWDEEHKWVLFDPFFDSSLLHQGHFASAARLTTTEGELTWRRPHEDSPDPNAFAGATIQYPEPWLYTRIGERCARWPFRGCFAQLGPRQLLVGPMQQLILAAMLACAMLMFVSTVRAFRLRR
jgi:hypothetical protein